MKRERSIQKNLVYYFWHAVGHCIRSKIYLFLNREDLGFNQGCLSLRVCTGVVSRPICRSIKMHPKITSIFVYPSLFNSSFLDEGGAPRSNLLLFLISRLEDMYDSTRHTRARESSSRAAIVPVPCSALRYTGFVEKPGGAN